MKSSKSGCRSGRFLFVFLAVLLLSIAIDNRTACAGDQEGVAGYRFKIYDADGDGIDGNEPEYGAGTMSSAGAAERLTYSELKVLRPPLEITQLWFSHWFIWLK